MSEQNAVGGDGEDAPVRDPWVERAPLLLGVAGAVVGVAAIVSPWPVEVLLYLHMGLAWLSLGLAAIAMLSFGRGQNVRAAVVLVGGIVGFGFWLAAPEVLASLPVVAYLVSAAVLLALGGVAPKPDAARRRAVGIACAGVVVFAVVGAMSRLGV